MKTCLPILVCCCCLREKKILEHSHTKKNWENETRERVVVVVVAGSERIASRPKDRASPTGEPFTEGAGLYTYATVPVSICPTYTQTQTKRERRLVYQRARTH